MATGWREMDGAWYYLRLRTYGQRRDRRGRTPLLWIHPQAGWQAPPWISAAWPILLTETEARARRLRRIGNETGRQPDRKCTDQAPDGTIKEARGQAPQPSQNGGVSNQAPGLGQAVTGLSGGPGVVVTNKCRPLQPLGLI